MADTGLIPALAAMDRGHLAKLARAADRVLSRYPLHPHGNTHHHNRPGQSREFLDHRNYTRGDDLRAIDWRASARSQHPQVRRYHDEAADHWLICLDRSASMRLWNYEKWNLALQMAAAWAYLALHCGNSVGLLAFSNDVDLASPVGRGELQYHTLLNYLNRLRVLEQGGGSNLGACIPHIKPRSSIVVISDFLTPDTMQTPLDYLFKISPSVHLMQIISPNECHLPPGAKTTLRDIESGERISINADNAATTAEQRLAQLQQTLQSYCRTRKFALTSCLADTPWSRLLTDHIKGMAPR